MRTQIIRAGLFGLIGFFAACNSENPTRPAPPSETQALRPAAPPASEAQLELARSVALAIGDEAVAHDVYEALKASPWNENKILLGDLLREPEGAALFNTAVQTSRLSAEELQSRINQLPPMDMYLPFDEHRASWKGTKDILVGITMDVDEPILVAYSTSGEPVILDARDGVPASPLLILHPAERKTLRTATESSESHGPQYRGMTPAQDCTPETCPGGGGGGGSNQVANLILHQFWIDGWYESFGGDMEIDIEYEDANFADVGSASHDNVEAYEVITLDEGITSTDQSNPQPTTARFIHVEEDDGGWTDDDFIGTGFVEEDSFIRDGNEVTAEILHVIDPSF